MSAAYTEPSALERELGREVACAATGTVSAHARAVADILAAHRHRCTALVEATLEEISSKGYTDHALQLFASEWTPDHVRGLIENAREVRRGLRLAPQLIRETLTTRRDEPSTYASLVAVRERLATALELARALRGASGERTAATVEKLITTLAG